MCSRSPHAFSHFAFRCCGDRTGGRRRCSGPEHAWLGAAGFGQPTRRRVVGVDRSHASGSKSNRTDRRYRCRRRRYCPTRLGNSSVDGDARGCSSHAVDRAFSRTPHGAARGSRIGPISPAAVDARVRRGSSVSQRRSARCGIGLRGGPPLERGLARRYLSFRRARAAWRHVGRAILRTWEPRVERAFVSQWPRCEFDGLRLFHRASLPRWPGGAVAVRVLLRNWAWSHGRRMALGVGHDGWRRARLRDWKVHRGSPTCAELRHVECAIGECLASVCVAVHLLGRSPTG